MLHRFVMLAAVGAAALAWTVGNASAAAKLGHRCGGPLGITCGPGLWCDPTPGHCAPGARGRCVRVPQLCPFIFMPVCGCNGRTYPNDCERLYNKEPKKHAGIC